MTESQAIAFFVTFFVLFFLHSLVGGMASLMSGTAGNVLLYMSFQAHLEGFERGLIDTRDVVYFLSVTAVALAVSFRVLERRKWA